MKNKTLLLTAVLGLTSAMALATPFSIVWNTDGLSGVTEDPVAGSVTGTPIVTPVSLNRGPDVAGVSSTNGFSSSGWNSTLGGEFIEFGFTVATGYFVNLDESFFGLRATNTGPGNMGLFISTDNFASSVAEFTNLPGGTWVNQVDDLSSLTNLQGTVMFRLSKLDEVAANSGAIASGGTFAFGRVNDPIDGLVPSGFTGTVQVIPEPGTLALIGVSALILYFRRRTKA